MTLFNLTQLHARLPKGQRLIGIDLGSRVIGLAVSDASLLLASPYGTLPRGKLAAAVGALGRIAREHDAGGLVIGLPLSMDGTVGPAAQAARDWAHAIAVATGLPAALWDERLSSAAVNRMLISEADATRRRRAEVVDKLAAAWILQGALDSIRHILTTQNVSR